MCLDWQMRQAKNMHQCKRKSEPAELDSVSDYLDTKFSIRYSKPH